MVEQDKSSLGGVVGLEARIETRSPMGPKDQLGGKAFLVEEPAEKLGCLLFVARWVGGGLIPGVLQTYCIEGMKNVDQS